MKELTNEIKKFLNKKDYIICLIITAIASYGFAITHPSIGIDDLCMDRYVNGTYLLPQKRWGTWLLYNILNIEEYTTFWLEFVVTLVFIVTAITFCAMIKSIVKNKISDIAYVIGSCAYISYPILTYQFTYQPTNLSVAVCNYIMLISVYCLYRNIKEHNKLVYVICGVAIGVAISMYESCVQTYIAYTFIILLLHLKYIDKKVKFLDIIYIGIIMAIELFIGIIIYQLIGRLICLYFSSIGSLPKNFAYNSTIFCDGKAKKFIQDKTLAIFYKKGDVLSQFRNLTAVFLLVSIYDSIKNKEWKIIFLNVFLVLSNFIFLYLIAIILYRSYYSWAIAVAFELMYIYDVIKNNIKWKHTEKILISMSILIILFQTKSCNQLLYKDYISTQYIKNIFINEIANVIIENSENYYDKKIILLEKNSNYSNLDKQFTQNMETYMWFYDAFDEKGTEFIKYLKHFGYYFENANEEDYKNYLEDYNNGVIKYNEYVSEGEKYIYVSFIK